MDPAFWLERWCTRQIGFHQSSPNTLLARWWPSLRAPADARVYIPLCGKSLDMVWLAVRGHGIIGTEISEIAVREFFSEQGADVESRRDGPFDRFRAGPFEILCGDAFALTPSLLGPVQAAYDRAALVALPPAQRAQYTRQFSQLLTAGATTLLVSFEYAQHLKEGPPFSIEPDDIQRLYGECFEIDELDRIDILDQSPKFAAAGVPSLYETAYRLTRR